MKPGDKVTYLSTIRPPKGRIVGTLLEGGKAAVHFVKWTYQSGVTNILPMTVRKNNLPVPEMYQTQTWWSDAVKIID